MRQFHVPDRADPDRPDPDHPDHPDDGALPPDRSFEQRGFLVSTRFEFSGDTLHYEIRRPSGSRDFTVDCGGVDFETGSILDRPVGAVAIGLFSLLLLPLSALVPGLGSPLLWVLVALAALAFHVVNTLRAFECYSDRGTMLVLDDAEREAILDELDQRRRDQLRHWHADIDFNNDPDREIEKFRWLESHQVISSAELEERISAIAQSAPLYDGEVVDDVYH